jgi:hypothetical protein
MLKNLILMLFATTLLATHSDLDQESDCALLLEDNFVSKYNYRMTLIWTLDNLERDLSLVKAYSYKEYKECRIEDEKMLKQTIQSVFNSVDHWKYMQFIKEKLLSKVTKGAKVGFILDEWSRMLLDMAMNIDVLLIKEPDLSGKGERWKLTKEQMYLNKFNISLNSIIPIETLDKKDVLFVKYEKTYREKIERWYDMESNFLSNKTYKQGYYRYVLKKELLQHTKVIYTDDKITSLNVLKQMMIDSILFDLDGEVLKINKIGNKISNELYKIKEQYLAQKEEYLRFVKPLFEELYSEDNNTSFLLPSGFGIWMSRAAVHEKPELLLQDYQEILFTWKNYHTGTIKLFADELIKEKKNSSQYYLSRTKLTENISKYFDKTKVENDIPSDFFLIEKLLLKGLPRQEKISLKELAVFWQEFLDTSITEQLIEDHFRKHYTEYNELEWIDFLIDLLPSMPTSIELVEWLQESKFD